MVGFGLVPPPATVQAAVKKRPKPAVTPAPQVPSHPPTPPRPLKLSSDNGRASIIVHDKLNVDGAEGGANGGGERDNGVNGAGHPPAPAENGHGHENGHTAIAAPHDDCSSNGGHTAQQPAAGGGGAGSIAAHPASASPGHSTHTPQQVAGWSWFGGQTVANDGGAAAAPHAVGMPSGMQWQPALVQPQYSAPQNPSGWQNGYQPMNMHHLSWGPGAASVATSFHGQFDFGSPPAFPVFQPQQQAVATPTTAPHIPAPISLSDDDEADGVRLGGSGRAGEISVAMPAPRRRQSAAGKRKRVSTAARKTVGGPRLKKPKKPDSAFLLWFRANSKVVKQRHPELVGKPVNDVVKAASAIWVSLSLDAREEFFDLAVVKRKEWEAEMAEYTKATGEQQPQAAQLPEPAGDSGWAGEAVRSPTPEAGGAKGGKAKARRRSNGKSSGRSGKIFCGDRSSAIPAAAFEWSEEDFVDFLDRWDVTGIYRSTAFDAYKKRWKKSKIHKFEERANRCPDCKIRFSTPMALMLHNAEHVPEDTTTQCRLCREKCGSFALMEAHELETHAGVDAANYVAAVLAWSTAKEQVGTSPFDTA